MFKRLRFVRAMIQFAVNQVWVDAPIWNEDDALALGKFYASATGARFKAMLQNIVVTQNAKAVSHKQPNELVYEAGYCAGQRGLVAILETLADRDQFSDQGDTEADPDTTLAAS